jgi:hypothetical protein
MSRSETKIIKTCSVSQSYIIKTILFTFVSSRLEGICWDTMGKFVYSYIHIIILTSLLDGPNPEQRPPKRSIWSGSSVRITILNQSDVLEMYNPGIGVIHGRHTHRELNIKPGDYYETMVQSTSRSGKAGMSILYQLRDCKTGQPLIYKKHVYLCIGVYTSSKIKERCMAIRLITTNQDGYSSSFSMISNLETPAKYVSRKLLWPNAIHFGKPSLWRLDTLDLQILVSYQRDAHSTVHVQVKTIDRLKGEQCTLSLSPQLPYFFPTNLFRQVIYYI